MNEGPKGTWDRWLAGGVQFAAIAISYVLIGPKLEPHHIDNPWYASMIYNYFAAGLEQDTVFGQGPEYGAFGGTLLFGKVFSFVSGGALSLIGWSPLGTRIVSSSYVFLAAGIWMLIGRRSGLGNRGVALLAFLMLLARPIVFAAMIIRPETFVMLLTATAVLLAVVGWPFFAGLAAAIALETHPIGLVAILLAGSALFPMADRAGRKRAIALAVLGATVGGMFYLLLHREHFSLLASAVTAGQGGAMGSHFALNYLLAGRYHHRLIEVPVLVLSAWLFVRSFGPKKFPVVSAVAVAAALFSLVPMRGNIHYMVVVLPPFMLLIAAVADLRRAWALVLVLALPYYLVPGLLKYARSDWSASESAFYLQQVGAAIPNDGLPVIGSPEEWWVFRDRRYHVPLSVNPSMPGGSADYYVIENEYYAAIHRLGPGALVCRRDMRTTTVAEVPFARGTARIMRCERSLL